MLPALMLALVVGSLAACDVGPPYPSRITQPDAMGVVASATASGSGDHLVVLVSGQQLSLSGNAHALQGGGASAGDLLFAGSSPESWFLSATFNRDRGCFPISASRAFSIPDSVVLAFGRWEGVGVQIRKAPDYDDSHLVVSDREGHLEYSGIGGILLCADDQGRLVDLLSPRSGRSSG